MAKRPGLTWEEHVELGKKLKVIDSELGEVEKTLPNRFGLTSKVGKQAKSARQKLRDLRCELDRLICAAFPEKENKEILNIYYGERESRA